MRRLLGGLLWIALCSTALAETTIGKRFAEPAIVPIASDPVAMYRQATGPRGSVASERADDAFLFAVVGSSPGAQGTYFRSEVTLVNNDTTSAQYVVAYYFPAAPGGGSCTGVQAQQIRMDANTFYVWPDFVNSVFHATGLGSVVVFGTDSAGNFDSTANIDGFSRIWTPVAGFQGTASQSFPSVAISGFPGPQYIFGLRQDPDFRTNLFIFNYLPTGGTAPRTFSVQAVGTTGATASFSMSVPPCSLTFQSISGNLGSMALSIAPPDSGGGWFAFGSSNDNHSGDNWSVGARPNAK